MKRFTDVFGSSELDVDIGSSLKEVTESSFYKTYFSSDGGFQSNFHWMYFDSMTIEDLEYKFSLCLYEDEVTIITFSLINEAFGYSSCDWSEVKEMARKEAHENLLRHLFHLDDRLDAAHFSLHGIQIDSLYDSRGSGSYVVLKKASSKTE